MSLKEHSPSSLFFNKFIKNVITVAYCNATHFLCVFSQWVRRLTRNFMRLKEPLYIASCVKGIIVDENVLLPKLQSELGGKYSLNMSMYLIELIRPSKRTSASNHYRWYSSHHYWSPATWRCWYYAPRIKFFITKQTFDPYKELWSLRNLNAAFCS